MCEADDAKLPCGRVKECHQDQLQAKTMRDPAKAHHHATQETTNLCATAWHASSSSARNMR